MCVEAVEQLVFNIVEGELFWVLPNHLLLNRGAVDVTNLSHVIRMISLVYLELPRKGIRAGGANSCEDLLDPVDIIRNGDVSWRLVTGNAGVGDQELLNICDTHAERGHGTSPFLLVGYDTTIQSSYDSLPCSQGTGSLSTCDFTAGVANKGICLNSY